MPSSIRVKAQFNGLATEVQALIEHPMDSGYIKDSEGYLIPPHYIETVTFRHQGKTVLTANWGPAVSKDPYLRFAFAGGAKGDIVTVTWIDNLGQTDTLDANIA